MESRASVSGEGWQAVNSKRPKARKIMEWESSPRSPHRGRCDSRLARFYTPDARRFQKEVGVVALVPCADAPELAAVDAYHRRDVREVDKLSWVPITQPVTVLGISASKYEVGYHIWYLIAVKVPYLVPVPLPPITASIGTGIFSDALAIAN